MTNPVQVESSLLGAMLYDSKAIEAAADLEVEDFFTDRNRRLLSVIRTMHAAGQHVDLVTFLAELNRQRITDSMGGPAAIAGLTDDACLFLDVRSYVKIVKAAAGRRAIQAMCLLMSSRAEEGGDPSEILQELQTAAQSQQTATTEVRANHISHYVLPTWNEMQEQMDRVGNGPLGIPTGIPELDQSTTGWRDGELTYVGASPGRGKTSFLLQSMYFAAKAGIPVGCISLEMRASQLVRRLGILESGLPSYQFRDPREIKISDRSHAKQSLFALGELPIELCDQSGLKPSAIATLARRMHANGARVIFIDFVQIIFEDGKERREAINRVSASLRDTCKSLNVPFVVASQLARRDADLNRRPTMQDLRESGNLEQDAHTVLLLYRPQYTVKDELVDQSRKAGDWTGEDEIIIGKQREGVTGSIDVRYDGRTLTYQPRN